MIIAEEHPLTPDLELLFQRHTADMHADTPPESIHMMDMIKNRHYFSFLEIDLYKHKSKDLGKEIAGNFEDLYPLIEWLRDVLEH